MLKNRRTRELVVHFNSSQHDISQMRFIIIEQIISFPKSITFRPVTAYQRSLLDDTIVHTKSAWPQKRAGISL